jgi:hypothetical protein
MDMVDNLEYAEGLLGGAALLDGYCRPTCSARENADGECQEDGGRDDCGCPCHEVELPEAPPELIRAVFGQGGVGG